MTPKKEQTKAKAKKIISIKTKKEIKKHEEGMCIIQLAAEYNMAKLTIATILKKKDVFKQCDVAKGVIILTKNRPPLNGRSGNTFTGLDQPEKAGRGKHQ